MNRHGSTLLELLVTLTIMAIVAGVVALAFRSPAAAAPAESAIVTARRTAVETRRAVTVMLIRDGRSLVLTALPDGGVVADSALRLDRFTGETVHAP